MTVSPYQPYRSHSGQGRAHQNASSFHLCAFSRMLGLTVIAGPQPALGFQFAPNHILLAHHR